MQFEALNMAIGKAQVALTYLVYILLLHHAWAAKARFPFIIAYLAAVNVVLKDNNHLIKQQVHVALPYVFNLVQAHIAIFNYQVLLISKV